MRICERVINTRVVRAHMARYTHTHTHIWRSMLVRLTLGTRFEACAHVHDK